MLGRTTAAFGAVGKLLSNRLFFYGLATAAAVYMYRKAHAEGVWLSGANGFGSDFHGTIWAPDRAVLHGVSPYPSAGVSFGSIPPAVYLPPIFLITAPLGWLSLNVATWVWFGVLMASASGVLALLGVRDPWCYAFMVMSLPVVQALVLGNASILVALGVALTWRFRHRPYVGPVALAATVSIKLWLWPLLVWLLIVRPRSGVRAAVALAVLTLGAWAVIGFDGLTGYPALMHTEGQEYARDGVLFVAALTQLGVGVKVAAAAGFLGGVVVLGAAWLCRSDEVESLSLALLAALVATPVAWPHYLILMGIPLVILWPRLALAWAWFPALWAAEGIGQAHGEVGQSLAFSLLAVVAVAIVFAYRRRAGLETNATARASA